MGYLRCVLEAAHPFTAVTRRLCASPVTAADGLQTLVGFDAVGGLHSTLHLLKGANTRDYVKIGPGVQLYEPVAQPDTTRAVARQAFPDTVFQDCMWDPYSGLLYICGRTALYSLDSDDCIRLVAGSRDESGHLDGAGTSARFTDNTWSASDGAGCLYIVDNSSDVRRVQLPASWRACSDSAARTTAMAAVDATSSVPASEVTVTTLSRTTHDIRGLAYTRGCAQSSSSSSQGSSGGSRSRSHNGDEQGSSSSGGRGSLLYASATAIYQLPLADSGQAPIAPKLLAGHVGDGSPHGSTIRDGVGDAARFSDIAGLVVDGAGFAYVADRAATDATVIRKVSPDGSVSTLLDAAFEDCLQVASILPNGCLVLFGDTAMHLVALGLEPGPFYSGAISAAPCGQPRRSLSSDLASLLDRQPDGTADLEVTVGDRTFHAHRGLLAARCDYFRSRLQEGGFADGSSAALALPDADPEAFALLLRFLYTGAVHIPSAAACAVAELADRLLLPELCRDAQAVVLAEVAPESVVGAMLWAESRGPGFAELLRDLKAWYLEHQDEVLQQQAGSLKRLMTESPDLMLELHALTAKRPRQL